MHEKKLVAKFSHAEIVLSTLQIFLNFLNWNPVDWKSFLIYD